MLNELNWYGMGVVNVELDRRVFSGIVHYVTMYCVIPVAAMAHSNGNSNVFLLVKPPSISIFNRDTTQNIVLSNLSICRYIYTSYIVTAANLC